MVRFSGFAFVVLTAFALAACGGGSGGPFYPPVTPAPSTGPTTAASSTVSFLVIVPGPTTAKIRRPNVVVPSNAAAVSFTLQSVNGTTSTAAATKETLSASNSGCQSSGSQLACVFDLTAPSGTLIYTVTVYDASNNVIAEGNVAVNAQAGQTVSAPVTLSGTAAKVAIAVSQTGLVGQAAKIPLVVQVEDASGNTILGNYTAPITLTLVDTSGATTLSTAGSDAPPAGELLSSSDTATLIYSGAAMSAAATISASASGLSNGNVTSASFKPSTNEYAQSGTVTLGFTQGFSSATNTSPPSPTPAATSTSYPIAIATGASFGSATNLIAVTGLQYPTDPSVVGLSPTGTTYYDWTATSQGQALGYVGYADAGNQFTSFVYGQAGPLQQACVAPYQLFEYITPPSSWNALTGTGACTTSYSDGYGDGDSIVLNADGSYTETGNFASGYNLPPGTQSITVGSDGAVSFALNSITGSGTMTVAAPSTGSSTVAVSFTPNPTNPTRVFYPTPAPSSAPNPWTAIGIPLPNPLQSDTFTNVGAIARLPAQCAVQSGLVPASNPPLTEVDETRIVADPMETLTPLYTKETLKHYYLGGVGEICDENLATIYQYGGATFGTSNFFSYDMLNGGAIEWYLGQDANFNSEESDAFVYVSGTTLTATQARVRSMTDVMPAVTEAVHEAGEQIALRQLQHAFLGRRPAIPHFMRR